MLGSGIVCLFYIQASTIERVGKCSANVFCTFPNRSSFTCLATYRGRPVNSLAPLTVNIARRSTQFPSIQKYPAMKIKRLFLTLFPVERERSVKLITIVKGSPTCSFLLGRYSHFPTRCSAIKSKAFAYGDFSQAILARRHFRGERFTRAG